MRSLFCFFYLLSFCLYAQQYSGFEINSRFPDVDLMTLDGQRVSTSDLQGKPIMLNFWSPGCVPCIDEIPELNKLKEQFGERVSFIAIAAEDESKIRAFLSKHVFDFMIVKDARDLFDHYKIRAIPLSLVVNRYGLIVYLHRGIPTALNEKSERRVDVVGTYGKVLDKLLAE